MRDSGDQRSVDPMVVADLERLITAAVDGSATVQVLAGPGEDTMILTTSDAALRRSGLGDGWSRTFPGGSAEIASGDDSDLVVAMLTRASRGRS